MFIVFVKESTCNLLGLASSTPFRATPFSHNVISVVLFTSAYYFHHLLPSKTGWLILDSYCLIALGKDVMRDSYENNTNSRWLML